MDDGSASVRVGFWNTWLLRPRLWNDGPVLPGSDRFIAPDVARRAPLVSAAIRDRFDAIALSEVFERSEQRAVGAGWPAAVTTPGPQRHRGRTASGLLTVTDPAKVEITHLARTAFRAGGDVRDSDTFATKGALLVRLRIAPDLPELDLFSTHLFAGGDLFPIPGANDSFRHHEVRMRQVDELVAFVEEERRPSNPLLVVGDLNVAAHDPATPDPTDRYHDLAMRLERIGLVDLWATQGVGPGPTSSFTAADTFEPDPDEPDQVADDPDAPLDGPGNRIDYLWLAQAADGEVEATATRPRRWAFTGRDATGGPAGSLSDHLALSTTIRLARP